jgi:hypothetical protein
MWDSKSFTRDLNELQDRLAAAIWAKKELGTPNVCASGIMDFRVHEYRVLSEAEQKSRPILVARATKVRQEQLKENLSCRTAFSNSFERELDSFFFFARRKFVSLDDSCTRIPPQQCVVVSR